MTVCTHGHTQPQPFMCLTESSRTHKQYTLEWDTVWSASRVNVTHFLPYLFLLPLLLLYLFFLPDLGEALLLALQLCFKVAFVRHGVLRGFKSEQRTGMSYVWHCHKMFWFHYNMIQYRGELLQLLGVAVIHPCTVNL